ncbi:sensor histidine kinase KdpD [uncultured Polaribacter sp.]|uniref:sensor histidine kinase n=1 Tax=uncultured Polaribacter sp. TaxID=174711 RepID=UPI002633F967|nr:HAMP domain-containing sensor histidine kinase [uncultured Polaribacter sp.]
MNTQKHRWILYLIIITIITTITVQFYWNNKNYQENKQRVANEIQLSLDNAIEEYYAKLAKEDITTIINFGDTNTKSDSIFLQNLRFDSIVSHSKSLKKLKSFFKKDTLKNKPKLEITNISFSTDDNEDARKTDSIIKNYGTKNNSKNYTSFKYFNGQKAADSIRMLKNLKPIFFSVTSNSIEYYQLDSLIKNQLKAKKIPIQYIFNHFKKDTIFYTSKDSLIFKESPTIISSKSTYLKNDEELQLVYNNTNFEALKRSYFGIFLSFLLSLAVIASLFYLLKIINQQKELATIKNDLISNITHEFKTPITTVSTAIEAIENFNVLDDKQKTQKYLSLSTIQLKKLHQMVEKLLETATLDSEQLLLKKEQIDIIEITNKIVNKHQLLTDKKELTFTYNLEPIFINVDVFHFENVISNLIDNAIKYGGNHIEININSFFKSTEISVSDDGNGIEKNQQEKIFDKFYRVPKGNTHNVKGFGIGLYYSKKIIEKHDGNLTLLSNNKKTVFKITLPNE